MLIDSAPSEDPSARPHCVRVGETVPSHVDEDKIFYAFGFASARLSEMLPDAVVCGPGGCLMRLDSSRELDSPT